MWLALTWWKAKPTLVSLMNGVIGNYHTHYYHDYCFNTTTTRTQTQDNKKRKTVHDTTLSRHVRLSVSRSCRDHAREWVHRDPSCCYCRGSDWTRFLLLYQVTQGNFLLLSKASKKAEFYFSFFWFSKFLIVPRRSCTLTMHWMCRVYTVCQALWARLR